MVDPSQLSEVLQLGRAVYVLAITLLVFSWTTVALRLWVRLRITKAPGWDDVTIIIALVCTAHVAITVGLRKDRCSSPATVPSS
jgi:hypothetical protein